MSAGNRNPGGKSQSLTREERMDIAAERERKKFPPLLKFLLWGSMIWTSLWAVAISSGWWSNKVSGCQVELSFWDEKITTSVIITALCCVVLTYIQSVWHERNV